MTSKTNYFKSIKANSIFIYVYFLLLPVPIFHKLYGSEPTALKANQKPKEYIVIGDSMVKTGLGRRLKRALEQKIGAKVKVFGKSASGLARPDVYDWQKAIELELKTSAPKEVAYVMIGTNDCQDIEVENKKLTFGTDAWTTEYESKLDAFAQTLCQELDTVYWLGLPPMRSKNFNKKILHLNQLTEKVLKVKSCIRYLPTIQIFGDKDGQFQQIANWQNKKRAIREADGIHISDYGARILVDNLIKNQNY